MLKEQRTLYVVAFERFDSNGGGSVIGVTSRKDWAEAYCDRQDPNWCESYDVREMVLDDPEVFPEAKVEQENFIVGVGKEYGEQKGGKRLSLEEAERQLPIQLYTGENK